MALVTRLEFRQGQSLTLTPQLQQAIKLLQMSGLELDAYIQAEIENNPLLVSVGENDGDQNSIETSPDQINLEVASDQISLEDAAQALDMGSEEAFNEASPGERHSGELDEVAYAGAPTDLGRASETGFCPGVQRPVPCQFVVDEPDRGQRPMLWA